MPFFLLFFKLIDPFFFFFFLLDSISNECAECNHSQRLGQPRRLLQQSTALRPRCHCSFWSDAIAVRPSSKAAPHGLCVYDPAVANNNVSKNRARSTACAHCASVSLFSFRKEKRRCSNDSLKPGSRLRTVVVGREASKGAETNRTLKERVRAYVCTCN